MKQTKQLRIIILIFIIFLLLGLFILTFLLRSALQAENNRKASITVDDGSKNNKPVSVKKVIEKYDSEYIEEVGKNIYVNFAKDLYNEDKTSNQEFFFSLVDELKPFFKESGFYLIDEEKNITIFAKYDGATNQYTIIINNIENYYNVIKADNYVDVENSKIVQESKVYEKNTYLDFLVSNNMVITAIEQYLGEGTDLDKGYKSYLDGTIKIKEAQNRVASNIIFSKKYDGTVLRDVKPGMKLSEIYKLHSDNEFGSVEKQYLGYRGNNLYYFFYEDEVSVYGYSYALNRSFERALYRYLDSGNLQNFVQEVTTRILVYDAEDYDVDLDIGKAHIIYPSRGIEIDIKDNDPKGIVLYSNYYFTDESKQWVKDGKISFNGRQDLIEKYEIKRRSTR